MARKLWKRKRVVSLGSKAFRSEKGKLTSIPEYHIWRSMLARCYSRKVRGFKNYGGRGIKVDKQWFNFENFYNDMGKRPSNKYSIERINNNEGYSKRNCMWVLNKRQQNNRRNNHIITFNGESKNLEEWASILGIKSNTLLCRLRRGRNEEQALRGISAFQDKINNRKRTCLICGKIFYPRKIQLKNGQGKYCSQSCNFKSRKKNKKGQLI